MSVISLSEYAGNGKLSEEIMRSLVTRSTDATALSDLARPYGYTDGPAIGVAVNITPDTGGIRGGVFVVFGDDNPAVFDGNSGVRKIWAGATRTLKFALQVRVCVSDTRTRKFSFSFPLTGGGCGISRYRKSGR